MIIAISLFMLFWNYLSLKLTDFALEKFTDKSLGILISISFSILPLILLSQFVSWRIE